MLFLSFHAGSWESWCCCCLIPADRPWDRGRRWQLEMADTRSVHETRFEAAVKVIQSLPKNGSFQPTNEMMLKFYSFYKQATEGPCKLSRPGFWDPIGRYKWDAWSSLGDMTKEEAMIAYVEEMKKILETMPMTEKVEELLNVIGPFYEIVEDKKSGRSSDLTSVRLEKISKYLEDLGNVLTSTPNAKTVNGKAESSDSGAESEEDEAQEVVKEVKQSDNHKKMMKKSADHKNLELTVTNGYDKDSFVQDIQNDVHIDSSSNDRNAEEVKSIDQNLEQTGKTVVCIHQDTNDDHVEDASGFQHLTSDSDSEVYCDSMEQFGQEEVKMAFLIGHRMPHLSEGTKGRQMGSGGDGERWGSDRGSRGTLNEQIALVLMRLQEDMQNVLQRLHKLETLTASQAKSSTLQTSNQSSSQRPSWWPFEMSPGALTFAIIWPFIAQWLVHLYYQRRRRKLN
ncbi:acyl-CoA-binding domain-containing protein 5 isoform X4 [Castor canadensis]|uniref:Acyl-CoA-binding domain-containing protein 5 isoform X4 n=1 Tax=Castor canadensis TaxID=51338 RepID=A0AC58L5Z0_CASCN